MGPILRHMPGERVPRDGIYALVGHYGEATNFAEWFNEGDELPAVTIAAEIGPCWYVRIADEADEATRAA